MHFTDIESELSYAYLHAVAAKAGVGCQVSARALDNMGIDATLHVKRDFGLNAILTELSIHIQLKAAVSISAEGEAPFSYFFKGIAQYNSLRALTTMPPKILIVLCLPKDREEWLTHSNEQLLLKRCAYWVSLRGAEDAINSSGQTRHLPRTQVFSPDGLNNLLARIARQEEIRYDG